jgi:hypothetical protein
MIVIEPFCDPRAASIEAARGRIEFDVQVLAGPARKPNLSRR